MIFGGFRMSSKVKVNYLMVDRDKLEKSNSSQESLDSLKTKMKSLLSNKIHGISFSPYTEDQNPARFDWISPDQIESRLSIIKPYVQWIRTFSCTLGNEAIAQIAKKKV
jgi:exo-beta-1,3-glucanase (GH17 family)